MRTITLNPEQQREAEILTRLEAEALDVTTAAELLGVSTRQVRRLRVRFRQEGMAVVVHGNSGRPPANRTAPEVAARILALAGPEGKYHDLNVCHMQELLAHVEQIVIGRSTLDRLLREAGLRQPAAVAPVVHRRRRVRRAAEGMLLQIDGSPFDWLEGRGPKASLIGAIDDATGRVLFLLFRPTEDQVGYILLLRSIAHEYGLPMSIYHDRHTILRSPKQPTLDDELAGQPPMSQVQRMMAELGIESITAHSPQAKGRIERLWGTLQDRLTKELRLAGVTTLAAANAFLAAFIPRYNTRFAQPARDPESAWVPLSAEFDTAYYFAVRATRKVRADHCIRFAGQWLQLLPEPTQPSLVGQTVTVHVVPEGDIYVYFGRQPLAYRRLTAAPTARPAPPKEPAWSKLPPQSNAKAKQRGWLYGQR
jgi:transposase